ncbi:uncharacterized protein LOC143291231 [Babylonia areolata]|uniref:uncharacterized protein LOC143291231 n=1 Tax=Babylonia areolata TaxID=304850 RepID=UPI003FD55DBF
MGKSLVLWILFGGFLGFAYGGCNEKYAAKPSQVSYITSPGYPGNFSQYVDCYYELYSTSDHRGLVVYVDVVDVTLSCDDDTTYLHVYDGFSRNPRFLGRICEGGQRTFESPRQTLYLAFRSRTQHAGRSRGFRLRVRTAPKYCHCYTQQTAVLDVTSTPALLTSPYYPYGTEPNVKCRWLLKAPEGQRVNLTVLHADMKGSGHCRHFALYVYDGKTSYDDKLLASVCHDSVQTLQSSGPYLLVVFFSGPLVYRSGSGVKLQYSTIPAEGGDKHMISQTLFYVITALLILLIFILVLIAVVKLFVLPKRRKQAERRRRAARARLTRVSRHGGSSSSQSESSSHSESGQRHGGGHAFCSRASSSSMSGCSTSSQLSGMSVTRLLGLYGLKKCRQDHRCSARSGPHPRECPYSAQRSGSGSGSGCGVVIRVPDFSSMYEAHGMFSGELPPSYEEAVRQGGTEPRLSGLGLSQGATGQGDISGQGSRGQEAAGQEAISGQGSRGQGATEQGAISGQGSRGQGQGRQETFLGEEQARRDRLAEALEEAVVAEVMRQSAREQHSRGSRRPPPATAGDDGPCATGPPPLREIVEHIYQRRASLQRPTSSPGRDMDPENQADLVRPPSCGQSGPGGQSGVAEEEEEEDGEPSEEQIPQSAAGSTTPVPDGDVFSAVASASLAQQCNNDPEASSLSARDGSPRAHCHGPRSVSAELAECERRAEIVSASADDEADRLSSVAYC